MQACWPVGQEPAACPAGCLPTCRLWLLAALGSFLLCYVILCTQQTGGGGQRGLIVQMCFISAQGITRAGLTLPGTDWRQWRAEHVLCSTQQTVLRRHN